MQLILNIKNTENISDMSESDRRQMELVVEALITTGSLTGVKAGQVLLHFDQDGIFQKVQHSYYPWVRRR